MPHFSAISGLSWPRWQATLLSALLGLATVPAAQAQSFGPPLTYSIGQDTYPYHMAIGDLNNDGILDLVGSNSSQYGVAEAKISVLLGRAGGGYIPAVFYSTGARNFAQGIALGDVTGDGRLDAVVAVTTGMQVFPGLGDGSFAAPKTYANTTNLGSNSVLLNDLNKDGKLDVVLSSTIGAFALTYLNQGTDFALLAVYQASDGFGDAEDLALGDITGDGKDDLVVANFTGHTVSVLPGKGDGSFAQCVFYPAGLTAGKKNDPISVALADLNKDGRLDVVTANYSTSTVGVLLGKADGTLGAMTAYASGSTTSTVCARLGDLNGDGRLDVAVSNQSGRLGILLGKNDGTLSPVVTFPTNYYAHELVLRDLNKDGRLDAVTVEYSPSTLTVLFNLGTYTPLAAIPALTAAQVGLYPNPAHERFTLELPTLAGVANVQADLLNPLGQVVRKQAAQAGRDLTFATAGLAAGVYMLRLQAGETMLTKRVVVQ